MNLKFRCRHLIIFLAAVAPGWAQANQGLAQRDNWCTSPENQTAYRRMVAELNKQFACQALEPRDCMVLTGAVGVGSLYGAAKAVQAHQATHAPTPVPTCQVRLQRREAEQGFVQVFVEALDAQVLVDWLLPLAAASGPCGISPETHGRMERMAQTTSEFARGEFERFNTAQRAVETNIRTHQTTIERELQALRAQMGEARVNNLGLGRVQEFLRSDQRALADGWNGFLRDRATRLRGELLAATQAGDENAARLAAVEIREFIGTNFSEEVQRSLRPMTAAQEAANFNRGSRAVIQQVDALLAQAPERYGQAATEFSRLCSTGQINCSEALKTALRELPSEYTKLSEASRATNLARVQHRMLGEAAQALRARTPMTGTQAREVMLRLTENMDRRFMIFGDFQVAAGEMGNTTEQLGRLATSTAGTRAAAMRAGATAEQAIARSGIMRGLVGIGGRALGGLALMAGTAGAALASTPVTAAMIVLTPTNTNGTCNGSVPTSVYADTDEYCRTQAVFSERTMAMVSMPVEQQMAEMQRFPEMCAVVRETFDSVKPTRWEGQCVAGADGRPTGVRAKVRGNEEVFQEATWGADGQMSFFRMYSPSGQGGIVRAGFGMTLEAGRPTEIRFRNEAAVRGARDFHRARLDSLNFADAQLYERYRPIPAGTDPNQVQGVQRAAFEEIQLAQAQFQANRMPLTEMAACCQGNHLAERCQLYGMAPASTAAPGATSRPQNGQGTH